MSLFLGVPCLGIYFIFSNDGLAPWKFMGRQAKPFEIESSVDIHTEEDLVRSEKWIVKNL
jgi:hypothetical protein